MTPILYEKDEIDFTSQGLGSLVEIYDVDVEEQRNGLLQLTASYPVSGARYADISVGRIILAKPNQRDDVHAFRIVSTELDISGYAVTIEADSITYDLTHNIVKHLNTSGNGQAFMTALKNAIVNPSVFNFYSDIATSSTTSLNYVNPMEAIMGTTGSFLQIWGGELKRENRRVAMFNRRGRDNVSTFRLGKNISGLKYSVDISSLVTRIIPTKSVQNDDQTTTTLEGTPVDSQYINNYEQIYTLPLEFTDDTIKTVADLNAAAKGWFTQSANTGRDKPTVTIDIDVLSLQDSADYQDKFKNLESVSLTDTVTVYVPEYGVNITAIVNELHYDPILDRVTKMTVGTAKQSFADSSRTQLSDLQDKIISVKNQADAAAVSANGKSTNYYGSVEPSHPQEGDTWFWVDGDKSGIKVFVNGDWVEPVDSDTQEKIEDAVTDAVTQAKAYSDQLVADNVAQVNTVLDDVQAKQADLTAQQAELDTKAQGYANKALADAKADTLATAAQTAKDAQEYTNTAKAEAISAATKADGVINQKIDDTASSITRTISQNKSDADGKISTAQSIATQALDGLTQKVSQNTYDAKVNELTGKVSTAQQTADGAVTTVGNYKQSNDERVASAESAIQQNASAITQKVSQTDYNQKTGELSGKISEFNQTAERISQSVSDVKTQVDGLSVGGRNLFQDSKGLSHRLWPNGATVTVEPFDDTTNMWHIVAPATDGWSAGFYMYAYGNEVGIKDGDSWAFSADVKGTGEINLMGMEGGTHTPQPVGVLTSDWVRMSQTGMASSGNSLIMYFNTTSTQGIDAYVKLPKLEIGNLPTDWTPAPEDVDNKISTVSQTVDGISSIVSDPATGLTKRVQTAEGSISTVQSNVSDLQTKQTQTANGLTTEISDRQKGDTNTLTQAKDFTTSSISNSESGMRSQITQTSDSIIAQIGNTNLVFNSEFDPDNDGWYKVPAVGQPVSAPIKTPITTAFSDWEEAHGSRGVLFDGTNGSWWTSKPIRVAQGSTYSMSMLAGRPSESSDVMTTDFRLGLWDSNKNYLGAIGSSDQMNGTTYLPLTYYKTENLAIPDGTSYISFILARSPVASDVIYQPMLNYGATASKYAPTYATNSSGSILTLLKDNWSIGIADNAGALASGIAGDLNGMTLISKKITLDGNTTVTGDFYAKGGNFKNINASNVTLGTLNGTNVNITNINANNIVSGAISGANLNINLNTGQVVFQKGRIYDLSGKLDINIDKSYISTASNDTRATLRQGQLILTEPGIFDSSTKPYLSIQNMVSGSSLAAAAFIARDYATVTNSANQGNIYTVPLGTETFSGLSTGRAISGKWEPTKVAGAERGVVIAGGASTNGGSITMASSPYIYVGTTGPEGRANGENVYVWSSYTYFPSSYYHTTSNGTNAFIASDGALVRSSSSSKYKLDIEYEQQADTANRLLTLDPATWHDKFESEQLDKFHKIGVDPERAIDMSNRRYYGIIAEDLVKAGLEHLVSRNVETGEVEGVEYSKIGVALIPIIRDLRNRLNDQYVEIERLKEQLT